MKKVDYYAQPWKAPKWLAPVLGGGFGLIALSSLVMIIALTRPPVAAVAAAPEAPAPAAAAPADNAVAAAMNSRTGRVSAIEVSENLAAKSTL